MQEPEFRAYYLLVHMADATGRAMCLSMLSAMPPLILASAPVQRALAVWGALETNNWARFFSLARKASYVEGCFLHRHFRRVRGRALRAMAGSMKEAMPQEEVQALLCTPDAASARMYCEHHGMAILEAAAEEARGGAAWQGQGQQEWAGGTQPGTSHHMQKTCRSCSDMCELANARGNKTSAMKCMRDGRRAATRDPKGRRR